MAHSIKESREKYGRKMAQGFIALKLQTQTPVEEVPKQLSGRVPVF